MDKYIDYYAGGPHGARNSLHKTFCSTRSKFTREDRSTDSHYNSCFDGPYTPNSYTDSISRTHHRTGVRDQVKFTCGAIGRTFNLDFGVDFYVSGTDKIYDHGD
jgi:hypothetical protein